MSLPREDLLRPVLGASELHRLPYSPRAHFLVAFFGGPIGFLMFSLMSSARAGFRKRDWPLHLAGLAVAALGAMVAGYAATQWGVRARTGKLAVDFLAVTMCGGFYLANQDRFRAADFSSEAYPSPWIRGLLATFIGGGLGVALLLVTIDWLKGE